MTNSTPRAFILALLLVLMAATRVHHFGAIPDASWAVFFIGGFYLRGWTRWAFPLLMALAVAVDYAVIRAQGINFWSHYCVSPAYWCLVPAYFALWGGGLLLRRGYRRNDARTLGLLAASLVSSVALCHLLSQGGFYWTSASVPSPSLGGWAKNYADWFLPYLQTTAIYVGLAAIAHVSIEQVARLSPSQHTTH